jgi:hypothetical protein
MEKETVDDLGIVFSRGGLGWREMAVRRRMAETDELLSRTLVKCVVPGGVRGGDAAAEERYEDVEDYDPVLRWHCRL